MHFSKPFFFYCPINTKRSLFSCDGYFKVLNVVSQKAVSPTCLVSESQKVEHFILSRSFYSILILFRRQQILLVLWALRVWESVCLKRGSKASMESWMPPSPGLGHCPRWGDLKVSDAEKGGRGSPGNIQRGEWENCDYIAPSFTQPAAKAARRLSHLRDRKSYEILPFIHFLWMKREMFCEKAEAENLNEREIRSRAFR